MNADQLNGAWRQVKGQAKQQWAALTDDDLTRIGGQRDELIGRLQARYGYAKDRASAEVDRWLDNLDDSGSGLMAKAADARNQTLDVVENFSTALRTSVKDNPAATLALTAAVAFVIGALWKS